MRHVIDHLEHIQRLTRGRDRDRIDTTLVEVLRSLLDARRVTLWQVVPGDDGERLWMRVWAEQGIAVPQSASPLAVLEHGPTLASEPVMAQALARRRPVAIAGEGGCRIVVPIVTDSDDRLIVVVEYDAAGGEGPHADTSGATTDWRIRLVEGLARIYENFVNVLDASERDSLTGLLNRKSFDDTFLRATLPAAGDSGNTDARRQRTGGNYWLAVVDVDHFKSVNDRFGHLIGDEVLLLMARILRSTFRHDDRVYRFGGEEFVVLMRAADADAARAALERLRAQVEAYPFPQVGRITVSVGYTSLREHDTPSDAFERADRAVYLAKSQGRNQVRGYETDVEPAEMGTAPRGSEGDVELF